MRKLLSKAELGLHVFTSKAEDRYSINDIYIEDGLALATNGALLAALAAKNGIKADVFPVVDAEESDARRIPYEVAERALKALPRKATIPVLETALFTGAELITTDLQNTQRQKITDSNGKKFPADTWRQSVTTKQPVAAQVVLNAELLKIICDYVLKHRESKWADPSLRITIFEREGETPVVTRFDSKVMSQPLTVWLMPMREDAVYPDAHAEPVSERV